MSKKGGIHVSRNLAEAQQVDHVRASLEVWRADARATCYEIDNPLDIEWLCGRIRALNDVLSLLGGTPPSVSLREQLEPGD